MTDPAAAIRRERIARAGFVDRPEPTVLAAARRTTAIQAQDPQASRFGLRARSSVITEDDVLAAIADRTVVRTWLMRATIHLVAADDVRWLTALIGPSFGRRFRKRWLDIGLTPEVLRRTADALPEVLSGRPPQTKSEIVAALCECDVTFPMDDPQAPVHVLVHATGEGLLCRGAERGRDSTFALVDEWLPGTPPGPRGDDALAELARRYFAAFAPATPADFTAWSGLPSSRAIGLIRDELEPVDLDGRAGFRPVDGVAAVAAHGPQRAVRLVAGFDNYLVGYRDRSLLIADELRPEVYVGGVIKPTVLVDGRVAGTWRIVRTSTSVDVLVRRFEPFSRAVRAAVESEAEDIGRFTGRASTCSFVD